MKNNNVVDLGKILAEFQIIINSKNLELDAILLYRKYYDRHKLEHGSYKIYLQKDSNIKYEDKMQERYDWICCCINEKIEDMI